MPDLIGHPVHQFSRTKNKELHSFLPNEIRTRFNTIKCDYSDAAIQLSILPRIPITIVIWGLDDEFYARASILFDQNTSEQIPLDALGDAMQLTIDALMNI